MLRVSLSMIVLPLLTACKTEEPIRQPIVPHGKQKIVAVIDTGIAAPIFNNKTKYHICEHWHKDLTGDGIIDTHGHGTNVSGLIDSGAKGSNYCQVIIKYYNPRSHDLDNMYRFVKAIQYAIDIHADYINISGGGVRPSIEEMIVIERALNRGIKIISAAGNERSDLTNKTYYPAMYDDRITVVGNGLNNVHHSLTSNYGARVNEWRDGENRIGFGITQTGTSQATAIYTGELIKKDYEETLHVQHRRQNKSH